LNKLIKTAAMAALSLGLTAAVAQAGGVSESANGSGKLEAGRQFSFNAKRNADGTVTGQATLVNSNFSGSSNPNSPYQLKIDITCMKVVGNKAVFGGTTKRTNDANLVDAVFFSVVDNGEPGKNDLLSRAYFWDDDPNTVGDPQACQLTNPEDLLPEPIQSGNIQVKG
jgi:hypothetical protein